MTAYSLADYRALLQSFRARDAEFVGFCDSAPQRRAIYLRHDVDFSLELAHTLAKVNHEVGVAATFFVLLRSHAYNLASARSRTLVEELMQLGQRLGFHYSHVDEETDADAVRDGIQRDFEIAQSLAPGLETVWAVHSPTPTLMRHCLELSVPGLVNATSSAFMRDMPYYSDANMRYSARTWVSIASKVEMPAQILLHPVYWVAARDGVIANLAVALEAATGEALREFELNNRWRDRFGAHRPAAVDELAAVVASQEEGR